MNKEEIEEIETLEIDFKDTDDLELALEVSSKKAIYLIDDLIKYLIELQQENKKYKEVIDKIDKYINDYNVFEVFSFPLMKRWEEEQVKSSIDYEFKTSLIKDLKDILKEVE